MKQLLLLITITILSTQLHAQKWGNRTAVWKYHFDWTGYHYYNFNVKVESDTVILGQPCIRIGNYRPEFSYLSGDTVYFLKNGAFRPTYYFAAKPGDTISFYNYNAEHCEGAATKLAIVEAVDSINAGTKFIKQFSVNVLLDSARTDLYITRFKYYENIGSDNDLYPMFGCFIDDDYYTLCNYGDSSITGYYLFPQDQSSQCALVKETAINETQKAHHRSALAIGKCIEHQPAGLRLRQHIQCYGPMYSTDSGSTGQQCHTFQPSAGYLYSACPVGR